MTEEQTQWREGRFIVLEGIDGAGTTTHAARLAARLRQEGRAVVTTREPSDGPIGVMIRQMLAMRITLPARVGEAARPMTRQTLAALFAADRLDHVAATVEPALLEGSVVISDRYMPSSLAYQGDVESGEDGEGSEARVDYGWVSALNARARVPDLTVFLALDVETSLARIAQRGAARDLYETRDKLERLVKRYDEVMTLLEGRGDRILRLDARASIEALHEVIYQAVSLV